MSHSCPHTRIQHRRGSGRCLQPGCPCLAGPPPTTRAAFPERHRRATVTVDESGVVLDFKRPERERLERMLWERIVDAGLPEPLKQFYWARPERQFRSDFAYPAERILLEVQGGIWARDPGRHNRGSGYEGDLSRSNLAAVLGWQLLAFSERMIRSGDAVATIKRALTTTSQNRSGGCDHPLERHDASEQLPLTKYNQLHINGARTAGTAEPRAIKEVTLDSAG